MFYYVCERICITSKVKLSVGMASCCRSLQCCSKRKTEREWGNRERDKQKRKTSNCVHTSFSKSFGSGLTYPVHAALHAPVVLLTCISVPWVQQTAVRNPQWPYKGAGAAAPTPPRAAPHQTCSEAPIQNHRGTHLPPEQRNYLLLCLTLLQWGKVMI